MSFVQRLLMRLGFLLVLAVTIRVVGGFFSPAHPPQQTADESPVLAAPLDDPAMRAALDGLGTDGAGDGASLRFQTERGPVTLTAGQVAVLNARYRSMKAVMARAEAAFPRAETPENNLAAWYRESAENR